MEVETATGILVNAGLVAGLVEALKRALGSGFNADRFGALLAIVVGVLTANAGAAMDWYDATLGQATLVGLTAGLAAGGIYAGSKQAVSRSSET